MVPCAVVSGLIGAMRDGEALGIIPINLPNLKSKYGILRCWLASGLKPLLEIVAGANGGKGGATGRSSRAPSQS